MISYVYTYICIYIFVMQRIKYLFILYLENAFLRSLLFLYLITRFNCKLQFEASTLLKLFLYNCIRFIDIIVWLHTNFWTA